MSVDWLPETDTWEKFDNLNDCIDYYYSEYIKTLKEPEETLTFLDLEVKIKTRAFSCFNELKTKTQNGKCGNTLFNCKNCPFLKKDEMFFHIVSNKNNEINEQLSRSKRKENNRVPGLFAKQRLIHVSWVRKIIEEYKKTKNPDIRYFESKIDEYSNEHIIYFWVYKKNYIVIIGKNLRNKQENYFYLKSAYTITSDDDYKKFERLYNKYIKRQEANLGVS